MTRPLTARAALESLRAQASPDDARQLARFFKTGPGEYAEGDLFLGVRVPITRQIARAFAGLPQDEILSLLGSPHHEARLLALLIWTRQFERATPPERRQIVRLYLENSGRVNNWDLVDVSADKILGAWLLDRPRSVLRRLARSSSVWERRIALLATFAFIRHEEFEDTLELARRLLDDRHDLIQKAAGWMLREVGKRDRKALEQFLDLYASRMPRTMLRYAIERLPARRRRHYLDLPRT